MSLNFRSLCLIESCPASPAREENDHSDSLKAILMRKITWLVIISYTLLMFKPVMPIVMDVLAHTFWEQRHLMTVHEVHGKFHVHYELINASHQSDKDKSATNNKFQAEEYLPVTANIVHKPVTYFPEKAIYRCYSCFYSFFSSGIDNPPPEA